MTYTCQSMGNPNFLVASSTYVLTSRNEKFVFSKATTFVGFSCNSHGINCVIDLVCVSKGDCTLGLPLLFTTLITSSKITKAV